MSPIANTITSARTKTTVLKVTARAFGYPGVQEGGNPVTVFLFPTTTTTAALPSSSSYPPFPSKEETKKKEEELRISLAKTCSWESVTVHPPRFSLNKNNKKTSDPVFRFYMPSGDEVPFCAHAAMGACAVIRTHHKPQPKQSQMEHDDEIGDLNPTNRNATNGATDDVVVFVSGMTGETSRATVHNHHKHRSNDNRHRYEISLRIDRTTHTQTTVPPSQIEQLLEQIGLTLADTGINTHNHNEGSRTNPHTHTHNVRRIPSIVNSSIARTKTLVPISSLTTLHSAVPPPDPLLFQTLCDTISSTGLYLYTPVPPHQATTDDGTVVVPRYECRQFPRASGYPEDPATGIAAMALAMSLERERCWGLGVEDGGGGSGSGSGSGGRCYEMVQGTAMGKRSKLLVRMENEEESGGSVDGSLDQRNSGITSIVCSGCVDIDSMMELVLE